MQEQIQLSCQRDALHQTINMQTDYFILSLLLLPLYLLALLWIPKTLSQAH